MEKQTNPAATPAVDEYHGVGGSYILLPNGKRVPAGSEAAAAAQNAQTAQPEKSEE